MSSRVISNLKRVIYCNICYNNADDYIPWVFLFFIYAIICYWNSVHWTQTICCFWINHYLVLLSCELDLRVFNISIIFTCNYKESDSLPELRNRMFVTNISRCQSYQISISFCGNHIICDYSFFVVTMLLYLEQPWKMFVTNM